MNKLVIYFNRVVSWFTALKKTEKLLVGTSLGFFVFFCLQQAYGMVEDHIDSSRAAITARRSQLEQIASIAKRYSELRQRRDNLQNTFAKSELTFEQVTTAIDKIVKDAINSDNYELRKPHPPTQFGFEYDKQEFTLIVKAISLEQLVKMLYQIEAGGKPIFLSKVDLTKAANGTDFSTVLEIYSISKSAAPQTHGVES